MSRRAMRASATLALFALIALLLSACVDEPTPTITPTFVPPSVTPLPETSTPAPTPTVPFPTGQPLTLVTYRHRSGVFTIPRPADWDVVDDSTDQRLLVRFIPPVGFGSRLTVDVTSPGPLTVDQMHGEAESYIARNYVSNTAYHEISRGDLPDGRFEVRFAYNDGRGAIGTETLLIQQAGSFFVAVRIFVSDADQPSLGALADSVAAGITVDPKANWGSSVGAINPAELLILDTTLWPANSDHTYYFGDVYNASPSAIANVQVKITLCDSQGAVTSQLTQSGLVKQMVKGGKVPFMFTLDKPQKGITVCSQSATADPAKADPTYTTSLAVQINSKLRGGFVVSLDGTVGNPNLVPVRNLHLVVVVYDVNGTIVGLTEITSPSGLLFQPGQKLPVKYTFETLAGKPDKVVSLIEAEVVPPTNPSLNP